MFFAGNVVDDLAFEVGDDDANVNRLSLPKPVAAADGLVVGLVRVGHADEHHAAGLLEVHPEPGDGRLRDEHTDLSVLEGFKRFGLCFRGH